MSSYGLSLKIVIDNDIMPLPISTFAFILYTKGDDRSILRLTYEVAVIDITHSGGLLH